MFSIFDCYIGKIIFKNVMITLFILISLSCIIKFFDQLRKTAQGVYTALSASYYTLLSVPNEIAIFFPMAALLGVLLGLGTLMQSNEIIVMQASGFTHLQIALSVMKTMIPLILLTMAIDEFIAPPSEQLARNFQARQLLGDSFLSTHFALWVKNGNNFIYIKCIKGNSQLNGVSIYNFNNEQRLRSVLYAITATWDKKARCWQLNQVNESDLSDPNQISIKQSISKEWETSLTPDKISVVTLGPDMLSMRRLYKYSTYLKQSGQKSERYRLAMWGKIFQPLSITVMMLMALSLIFGPLREVSMGMHIIIGITLGFLFYVMNQILSQLSLVYGIPPILSAIFPTLAFFAISLWILMKRY